jgi:hypothetical protein
VTGQTLRPLPDQLTVTERKELSPHLLSDIHLGEVQQTRTAARQRFSLPVTANCVCGSSTRALFCLEIGCQGSRSRGLWSENVPASYV